MSSPSTAETREEPAEQLAKRTDTGERQVPGVERLAREMANAGNAANFRGQVHNLRVVTDRIGVENVRRVEFKPKTGGEIDIETTDGRIIESKGGQSWRNVGTGDDAFESLQTQLSNTYQRYAREEGRTIEVHFEVQVSDEVREALLEMDRVRAVETPV